MKIKVFGFICAIAQTFLIGMAWGGFISNPDVTALPGSICLTILAAIPVALLAFDYFIDSEGV